MSNEILFARSGRKWQIYPAVENDLPFLKEVEVSAASIFPPGILPSPGETLAICEFRKAMLLGRLTVCRNGSGRPIGFALWQERGKFALLAEIDVLPEYGRQGIGTALVEGVAYDVARGGFPLLFLTTFGNLAWNAPFYRKLGFTIPHEGDLPEFVRQILANERERGMENRVAMRFMTGQQ